MGLNVESEVVKSEVLKVHTFDALCATRADEMFVFNMKEYIGEYEKIDVEEEEWLGGHQATVHDRLQCTFIDETEVDAWMKKLEYGYWGRVQKLSVTYGWVNTEAMNNICAMQGLFSGLASSAAGEPDNPEHDRGGERSSAGGGGGERSSAGGFQQGSGGVGGSACENDLVNASGVVDGEISGGDGVSLEDSLSVVDGVPPIEMDEWNDPENRWYDRDHD